MVNKVSELLLSGQGYLREVSLKGGEGDYVSASIEVINTPFDDISLLCKVNNLAVLTSLEPLYQAWKNGLNVKLSFTCNYRSVFGYYSGVTDPDPNHMLTLRAELIEIREWSCEDDPVEPDDCLTSAQCLKKGF